MAKKKQTELNEETEVMAVEAAPQKSGGRCNIFTNMRVVVPALCVAIVLLLTAVIVQAVAAGSLKVFPNNDPRGSVAIIAVDMTGTPVRDVRVVSSNGRSARTNANGLAQFRDMPVGGYTFQLSRSGWATMRVETGVSVVPTPGINTTDTFIAGTTTEFAMMRRTTETVRGVVTLDRTIDEDGRAMPLGGVELTLLLGATSDDNFFPDVQDTLRDRVFSTKSADDGTFEFRNLPEGTSFVIHAIGKSADGIYNVGEESGETFTSRFDMVGWTPERGLVIELTAQTGNQFRVEGNSRRTLDENVTKAVAITFTQAVANPLLAQNSVNVPNGVLVDKVWSNGGRTLTLTAAETWFVGDATTAEINFAANSIKTAAGLVLPATRVTLVAPAEVVTAPLAVTGLAFTGTQITDAEKPAEGADTLWLEWNWVEGFVAADFEIYRLNANGSWTRLANLPVVRTVEVPTGELDEDGDPIMEDVPVAWRLNLIGIIGTAEEIRAIDEETTFTFAVVPTKNEIRGLHTQRTVTFPARTQA